MCPREGSGQYLSKSGRRLLIDTAFATMVQQQTGALVVVAHAVAPKPTCPRRRERGARFMTISTSRPSNVRNCMSRSVEKPESCPRSRREIFGWSIFKMRAAPA